MSRIRTIKPEFFEDERLSRLPPHDRLMFIGTWQLADKNGVLEYRPEWIKAKVFPYEHGEAVDASQVLHRLILGGFLIHYEVDGREYLQVKNFSKHQRINGKEAQAATHYPTFDNELAKEKNTGSTREAPGVALESQEGKGREGKGKEWTSAAAAPCDERFDRFWDTYGKKKDRKTTFTYWSKMSEQEQALAIAGIETYKASVSDSKYMLDPVRYLKRERWNDDNGPTSHTPHQIPEFDQFSTAFPAGASPWNPTK